MSTSSRTTRAIVVSSLAVAFVGGVVVGAAPAYAVSTLVDCANGGDLDAAIASASAGTTLVINGTCHGTFVVAKNLTLNGLTGAMLDAQGLGRVLTVNSGKVKVTGLTLTNGTSGASGDGGDVFNDGNLTIAKATVSAGVASSSGAGIFNSGTLKLTDSVVTGGVSSFRGAGIYNDGSLTVSGSAFSGGVAQFGPGGGLFNDFEGVLTLTSSTVAGNVGAGAAGGLLNFGTVTISASTVSGNTSPAAGGGIYNSGVMTLNGSTVSGNSADGGGGIASFGTGSLTISNSTIASNTSVSNGGGIYNTGPTFTITRSTISGNDASGNGGGIYGGGTFVNSSVVAGNTADGVGPDCDAGVSSSGYNLLGDADGCFVSPATGDLLGSSSGSGAIDPMLAALGSNGGPTQTMPPATGSPAVDSIPVGSLASDMTPLCPSSGTKDQRGVARPQGVACDRGAYELNAPWIDAVSVDSGVSGTSPSVTGTIVCNQGATFAVSVTVTQGKHKAVGASGSGSCSGVSTPVVWTAPVAPGPLAVGAAKVSYTATVGAVKRSGKTTVMLS